MLPSTTGNQSGSASWVKCHLVYGGGLDTIHCYIPSVCWTFMTAYCVVYFFHYYKPKCVDETCTYVID